MNKLIVILGPTASGKTALSIKLAKKFNGEIVSADSRQIYKGMDIGTAKPSPQAKPRRMAGPSCIVEGVAHWLIDIKNPNELYSVAEYKENAIKIIKDIHKRGKTPIMAGGTGLYIKSVVENLDIPQVEADPILRQKIEKEIEKKGLNFVFEKLIKLDPEAAYIVDPKNPRRVIRALEITLLTKKPFSSQRKSGKPLFDVLEIGILTQKEKLKERINFRIDKMVKEGLVDEVKNLIKKYGKAQIAFDAIGYREIIDYLNKKITLEQALENMKINTWHYAKRQMTWFNADKKVNWIKNYKEAEKLIKKFL
ncbi:MAG: tRNA (adenosine(37)-N6)-dimethylallyltransferase MiaA [Candidatus Staskawiczbacteria bacterium]|nr:tRNA (adenosine(37)-N6)-dimethylallyltransferase MiaA [Candidatus Staskawiczbacteria bacterium]